MSYRFIDENGEHLHTFKGQPLIGTTTALQIKAKPLTWWAAGMAVKEFGWTNPKEAEAADRLTAAAAALEALKAHTPEDYLKRLDRAYRAHDSVKNKAATKGTNMHAELEYYVRACLKNNGKPVDGAWPVQAVKKFSDWALENVDTFLWSEAHCYSETLWMGGISDCGAKLKDGHTTIIYNSDARERRAQYDQSTNEYAKEKLRSELRSHRVGLRQLDWRDLELAGLLKRLGTQCGLKVQERIALATGPDSEAAVKSFLTALSEARTRKEPDPNLFSALLRAQRAGLSVWFGEYEDRLPLSPNDDEYKNSPLGQANARSEWVAIVVITDVSQPAPEFRVDLSHTVGLGLTFEEELAIF